MKYKKGRGFIDGINNLSFNQQGPSWGMGFAPPYGGALLGANGKGRRILTTAGRIRNRRGRGVMDYVKSAWNYIKGNKDLQKYGKEGIKYLGGHAKTLIKSKVDALKRKFDSQHKTPTTPSTPPKAPIGMPAKEMSILPSTRPALKRSLSADNATNIKKALDKLQRNRGRGIKKIMMKKRKGGRIRRHYKGKGLPPLPPGLRA